MRFSCEQCSARYSIADEKVRGKLVAVRCTKCGAKITVNGKALNEPEPEMPTRVADYAEALKAADAPRAGRQAPPETLADGWFVILEGQQSGPLGAPEMRALLSSGRVTPGTYAWRDGQGDWKRASELPALAVLLSAPPAPARARPAPPVAGEPPPPARAAPSAKAAVPADAAAAPTVRPRAAEAAALHQSLFDGEFESDPTVIHAPVDLAALAERPARPIAQPPAAAAPPVEEAPDSTPFAPEADPFAAVSERSGAAKPAEIGEQTRFLMQKAGVARRNSVFKVAAFLVGLVGLPVAALYLLSNVGIATIAHVDATTGQQVERPIFSSEGMSDLRQRLLGAPPTDALAPAQAAEAAPVAAPVRKPRPPKSTARAEEKPSRPGEPVVARPEIAFGATGDAYESGELEQLGPRLRPDVAPIHVDGAPGLDQKVIGETVGKNLKAFQLCNENELRRNPRFKGGKIAITVTVGPSGVVTRASIDKPDIDQSALGACLKEKARRVAFPAFDGEAFDVEIPLVLTRGA